MGCCQSEQSMRSGPQSEIVTFERKDEVSNIFEDQFYMDSVERYNVKYRPPSSAQKGAQMNGGKQGVTGSNANIVGDSGASGGLVNQLK